MIEFDTDYKIQEPMLTNTQVFLALSIALVTSLLSIRLGLALYK
jgi:photosystem I reaction center subunit XII